MREWPSQYADLVMRMKWLLLLLFGGVGLALLIYGATLLLDRYALIDSGQRAEGTVVEQYHSRSTYRDERTNRNIVETYYYAVVEFRAANGDAVRFRGATGSRTPEYEIGAVVEVLYDPVQPHEALILTFSEYWLWPLVSTVLGLVFLFGGIGGYYLAGHMDREHEQAFQHQRDRSTSLRLRGEAPEGRSDARGD